MSRFIISRDYIAIEKNQKYAFKRTKKKKEH